MYITLLLIKLVLKHTRKWKFHQKLINLFSILVIQSLKCEDSILTTGQIVVDCPVTFFTVVKFTFRCHSIQEQDTLSGSPQLGWLLLLFMTKEEEKTHVIACHEKTDKLTSS